MEVEQIDLSALQIKDEKSIEETPLEFLESVNEETVLIRRYGRKKMPSGAVKNRRVLTKPKKLDLNNQSSIKAVEDYYLSQKIELTSPALETIFEEPKQNLVFSTRRLRRTNNIPETSYQKPDISKVKKRGKRAKKTIEARFEKLGEKLGLDILMRKLKDLDSENEC